jgi:hypothetical protein
MPYSARLLAATLCLLGPLSIVADEPPAGDLWQVTSKMSMEGMPFDMPARTMKVCAKKNPEEPPGSANGERGCVNSDMNRVGSKVTWTSTCAGPPAMTGQGEITYDGTDSYTGTIKYASAEGNMTINLTGNKVGGCDKPR